MLIVGSAAASSPASSRSMNAARILSATAMAPRKSVSGRTTANSSLP
jgi:hypothetical protein